MSDPRDWRDGPPPPPPHRPLPPHLNPRGPGSGQRPPAGRPPTGRPPARHQQPGAPRRHPRRAARILSWIAVVTLSPAGPG